MNHDYRDVLLKAASYVEQGWCQHATFMTADDEELDLETVEEVAVDRSRIARVCALGAMGIAWFDLGLDKAIGRQATDRLAEAIEGGCDYDIADWNDAKDRTADEVAEAMRRAAEE